MVKITATITVNDAKYAREALAALGYELQYKAIAMEPNAPFHRVTEWAGESGSEADGVRFRLEVIKEEIVGKR